MEAPTAAFELQTPPEPAADSNRTGPACLGGCFRTHKPAVDIASKLGIQVGSHNHSDSEHSSIATALHPLDLLNCGCVL